MQQDLLVKMVVALMRYYGVLDLRYYYIKFGKALGGSGGFTSLNNKYVKTKIKIIYLVILFHEVIVSG